MDLVLKDTLEMDRTVSVCVCVCVRVCVCCVRKMYICVCVEHMYALTTPLYDPSSSYTGIDECALNSSLCQQLCIDVLGSYSCDCFDGFQLEPNGTCVGKES